MIKTKIFYIGKLKIDNPIILAPMAGITDHPFRVICRNMGAGLVYTEFVSSDGIIRENLKTLNLMKFSQSERPIGIQIFGNDPEIVGKSASKVYKMFKPDLIDINFGCPVPKVTKRGSGSGALKNLSLLEEIARSVVCSVPKDFPITVKMRSGWNSNNIVSTKAGILLEKVGIKAITLHPRTTEQRFTDKSNWTLIKELKEAVNIPVIGNGDIINADDFFRMIDQTNCDAVMIGRGTLGNPWIFSEIHRALTNKKYLKPSIKDRFDLCKKHFLLLKQDKNEAQCLNLAKKHINYYLKGFNGAADWRKLFMKTNNIKEIENLFSSIKTNINY